MYIIGIDEAGRGALAGPVVAAAVLIPRGFYPKSKTLPKLRDSKKLNPHQRNLWFNYLMKHPRIFYAASRVYPSKIEKLNVYRATNLATGYAFNLLFKKNRISKAQCKIFLDGGLRLKIKNCRTVIKGDEKIVAIKLASIVAKVSRDKYMERLHQKYPVYQFSSHKGYGTALHCQALKRYGPSEIHRLTFLKKSFKL